MQIEQMEIIEIGAVLLNDQLDVVDEFQTFVRSSSNSVLTPFGTQFTTITQHDVDGAPSVHKAFSSLAEWLKPEPYTPRYPHSSRRNIISS